MKKIAFYATMMIIGSLMLSACKGGLYKGFKKSDSGMYYRTITKNADGQVPQMGDILFLTVSCHSNNDSINNSEFFKSFENRDMTDMLGESYYTHDLQEAYAMMKEGEEKEFILKADSFFLVGFDPTSIPSVVSSEDVLYIKLKLNRVATIEELMTEEADIIAKYVQDNNITATPTEDGLYIEEIEAGTGNVVDSNNTILVNITLKDLKTDTIINSSAEMGTGEPLKFIYGQQPLLPVLDKSIATMKKGGKYKVICPDRMAYQGKYPNIPLCTPMLFEIELIDIIK